MRYYKQCKMDKPMFGSISHQTAWIPEQLAHVGQQVRIHIQQDLWDEGWTISEVGTRMDEEYVSAHERNYLTQAQASDAVRDSDGVWKKVGE